jgi:hypothetical protein
MRWLGQRRRGADEIARCVAHPYWRSRNDDRDAVHRPPEPAASEQVAPDELRPILGLLGWWLSTRTSQP